MATRRGYNAAVLAAILVCLGLLTLQAAPPQAAPAKGEQQAAKAPAAKAKKNPLLKMIEPWPAPEKMVERREEAEALPLFASPDPIAITLVGDFKQINRDHDPNSRKVYPGALRIEGAEVPVEFRARGHSRRAARTCEYVPLRVDFGKRLPPGNAFGGQDVLKLVVQCAGGGEYEQFIYKEYLAYKIFNTVTKSSFRARLARVSYVDKATGKAMGTRVGMFLEDEGDVARRMEGRIVELPRLLFTDVHTDTLMPMMIFQYLIGNTDYSIYALHNVRIVQRPDKTLHPVPYDFDYSGLVNTPYSQPARGLNLKTVTERMYRGPCRAPQELVDPHVANFVAKRDIIRALPDQIPGISRQIRDESRSYIDSFYSSVRSAKDVRGLFVNCPSKTTM